MHKTVKNLINIQNLIKSKLSDLKLIDRSPKIIAVSKTFKLDHINPLIDHGHIDFGENKVQEAVEKWTEIKSKKSNIKLHMIGKLQTNKVKQAVGIFDYIHSVDSIKLANKISDEQKKQNKKIKIFLQVNIGEEIQKSGSNLDNLNNLVSECKNLNLDVIGLMCLPPLNEPTTKYFSLIKTKNDEFNFKELSLGMSNDYTDALNYQTTFIRVGTKIFGKRG